MTPVVHVLSKFRSNVNLRQSFLVFWLAITLSIAQWVGAATFSTSGWTSIASAQRGGPSGQGGGNLNQRVTDLETENALQGEEINTNTTANATQDTAISTNTITNTAQDANIAANTTTNTAQDTAISSNSTGIATNTTANASQDTAISTNTITNTAQDANIAANTTTNTAQDTAISSNSIGIATNTGAIASNQADIIDLQNNTGSSNLWTPNGNDIFYNSGNVGIGTANPEAALQVEGDLKMGFYVKLSSASKTIHVATTGNDATGDGTIENPYLTVQKALTKVPSVLDHTYTIQLADGTYVTQPINIQGISGRGHLIIQGNTGNASVDSLSVSIGASYINIASTQARVTVRFLSMSTLYGISHIQIRESTYVVIDKIKTSRPSANIGQWVIAVLAYNTAYVKVSNSKFTTNQSLGAMVTSNNSYIQVQGSTFIGGGNHSNAALEAANGGTVYSVQNTISNFRNGALTGQTHYSNAWGGGVILQETNISSCTTCMRAENGGFIRNFGSNNSFTSCTVSSTIRGGQVF